MRLKLFVLFIVVGVVLAIVDPFTLPIYCIVLPIHVLFLSLSIKTKNLPLIMFAVTSLASFGIGSTTFYLMRSSAEYGGFMAIKSFNFSYEQFFGAYSFFFVFWLFLILFLSLFKSKARVSLFGFAKELTTYLDEKKKFSPLPITLATIVFMFISVWMYSNKIGMIGIEQKQLPFHLTGILFYSRLYIFPLVIAYLYIRTKNKLFPAWLIFFYALISGFAATSKGVGVLCLVLLAGYSFIVKQRSQFFLFISFTLVSYLLIGDIRVIAYDTLASIDYLDYISIGLDEFWRTNHESFIIETVDSFCARLFGIRCTVLCDQFYQSKFQDLVSFYSMSNINDIYTDIMGTFYSLKARDDGGIIGVCFGYVGTFQLLSCHNYFYSIIQSAIIAFIFYIQNNCLVAVLYNNRSVVYRFIAVFFVMLSFWDFLNGTSMVVVYMCTLMLLCIRIYSGNKRYKTYKIRTI